MPWVRVTLCVVAGYDGSLPVSDGGLDVRAVAMLGLLSAVGALVRRIGSGTGGVETVFVLLVLGGRVFGAGFGFLLGVKPVSCTGPYRTAGVRASCV